ncbi:MAG: hypothetical protein ACM3SP_11980 [Chloroflexota bacterium]
MNLIEQSIPDSIHHRGCGIHAASFSVGPQSWLPEACVWMETEAGLRRMWVRSFAHCFDAEKLTFPNKYAADSWALGAAQAIIDRAMEQLTSTIAPVATKPAKSPSRIWQLALHPLQKLGRLTRFRSSH